MSICLTKIGNLYIGTINNVDVIVVVGASVNDWLLVIGGNIYNATGTLDPFNLQFVDVNIAGEIKTVTIAPGNCCVTDGSSGSSDCCRIIHFVAIQKDGSNLDIVVCGTDWYIEDESSSSSSTGILCDCTHCPDGAPQKFTLVAGAVTNGTCGCDHPCDCTVYSGTFILDNAGPCVWSNGPCVNGCIDIHHCWTLSYSAGKWWASSGDSTLCMAEYTTDLTWDCKSGVTLSLVDGHYGCGWPATVTITPVGDVVGGCS